MRRYNMKHVLVSRDNVSNGDYYAGLYQFQGVLYPYFASKDIKPKIWKTRKGAEKALLQINKRYGNDYKFYIKEIE